MVRLSKVYREMQDGAGTRPARAFEEFARTRGARARHMEDASMKNTTRGKKWISALLAGALIASLPVVLHARDPGVNQPGAAGNVGRDPGVNQPGAAGNVGRDPGVNQPGAAGNVGRDPGINQPGAAGNVGRDPGRNQPGAAGNRRR